MFISDYNYDLPDSRIAKFPLEQRDISKLLLYREGAIDQTIFRNISSCLPQGALMMFNNTKVVRARIIMHKSSGARIEIFCLEPHEPADYERAFAVRGASVWHCMIGNSKKWKDEPLKIDFDYHGAAATLTARRAGEGLVAFEWSADATFGELLEHLGRIPIPPYLCRESEDIDNTRYQTVYSKFEGSVAAPTAGLHFSEQLIEDMRGEGFGFDEVTLHVGAGTFLPVKSEDVTAHAMHTEHFEVTLPTLEHLLANRGRVVAVGTTTVRTLESLTPLAYRIVKGLPLEQTIGQWEAYDVPEDFDGAQALQTLINYMKNNDLQRIKASTQIMIRAPFTFRFVDIMVTNFHQPKSTLLLLVSAFVGEDWHKIYDYAMANDFRFLSYGDSSLLMPNAKQ